MKLYREIPIFDNTVSVCYTNETFKAADTSVAVYDKYKISILLSNGINAVMGKTVINGTKNNIFFFRPDELHFGRFYKNGRYAYLDIFIPTALFDSFTGDRRITDFLTDRSDTHINCIRFSHENEKIVRDSATEIIGLLRSDDTENNATIFSIILDIIILCNSCYKTATNESPPSCLPATVTQTMSFIAKNYAEKLSLKLLAKKAHCSVTYLSRIFKQYTQMTVYEYITSIRIANAQALLNENFPVTEVCFLCGFNDCSNFISTFKKITGTTPLKYQKDSNRIV